MSLAIPMVEVLRGDFVESIHFGHAVISNSNGEIIEAWGDQNRLTLPRSSSKILQAIPLVESGAARNYNLKSEHLALACASHQGSEIHTNIIKKWLNAIDKTDNDLHCGKQFPSDPLAYGELIKNNCKPCQYHNNCSGKHVGFLTLSEHLKGDPDYNQLDHPVQKAIKSCFEDLTHTANADSAIDGCSAPNFACSLHGLAQSMAIISEANEISSSSRTIATYKLAQAMLEYPHLVAGEGRACTELMLAMNQRVVVKTGAEAVFIAIIPELKLGIALKIEDGNMRASEAVITELLVRYNMLDRKHPMAIKRLKGPIRNWNDIKTGEYRICF